MYANSATPLSKVKLAQVLIFCLRVSLAVLVLGLPLASTAQNPAPADILVGIRAENDDASEIDRLSAAGDSLGHDRDFHDYRLKLRKGLTIEAAIAALKKLPEVRYAEANGIALSNSTPNDYFFTHAADAITGHGPQYGPQKIHADAAWGIWQPRKQIVIAIVDSGIDSNHLDLHNKILQDANGMIYGYNSVKFPYPSPARDDAADDVGHGTFVAGVAAAQINNDTDNTKQSMAGIAGWN